MDGLIKGALTHRKVTLLLTAVVVLYGLIGYRFIPKQEVPEFPMPAAVVTTIYPGATPLEVEEQVSSKIEDAVADISGLANVRSYSRSSVSIVVLILEAEVSDTETAWRQLRQRVGDIESDLPDQAEKPLVNTNLGETAGIIYALSGEGFTSDQLAGFAKEVKRGLSRVDGIARMEVVGEIPRQVEIRVDAERLLLYDLSLEDVLNAVRAQNLAIPSGFLEKDGIKIDVSTPGTFETLADVQDMIVTVSPDSGAVVRLKDLAEVGFTQERGAARIIQGDEGAVLLAIYFKKGRNVVLIGDDVEAQMARIRPRLPPRLNLDEVLYQPKDVSGAVSGFIGSLLQGVALVILVVFLGMGLRNAVVVSTAIPISVTVTFAAMNALGVAIHSVSTMALIISLGMLVDNAIVIADAIQVRLDGGMSRMAAALDGARDSAIPVFSATLTTVSAYAPLLFLPGSSGKFAEALPTVVIIALSASYVVAMLVTPAMASLVFRPLPAAKVGRRGIPRRAFRALLERGLSRPWAAVAVALLIFGGALWLKGLLGLSFFPPASKPFAYLTIRSEVSDLDKTEAIAREIGAELRTNPEITQTTTSVGEGLPKFYFSSGKASQSDDYAQILFHYDITLGERFERQQELMYHLQKTLQQKAAGATISVKEMSVEGDGEAAIRLRVSGDDLDRIHEVAREVRAALEAMPGVFDVGDDSAAQVLQLVVDVDEDIATGMGITKYDVLRQVNIALYGAVAGVYRNSGRQFDIRVTSDITTQDELENLGIRGRFSGTRMLIKQLAELRLAPNLERVTHYQRERSVSITAKSAPGTSAAAQGDLIEKEILPTLNTDGTFITFDGERERIGRLFGSVLLAAAAAVGVVYIILFVQFSSFLRPVVILVTVPLSSVGAILGLFLFRQDMSFTATLGMASLVGIVVNNAILLIDYIDKALGEGHGVRQACIDAVEKRYRPIMLSTITTALGLTPLLVPYDPLFTPMAISLMMGLLVSTVLTMVMIPVVFTLIVGPLLKGGQAGDQAPEGEAAHEKTQTSPSSS